MNLLRITTKDNQLLGDKIKIANTFFARFRGLMMTASLSDGEGLFISPCNSIHMMFMRFPIDAIFIDTQNQVKALYRRLKPWLGLTSIHRNACSVLELKAGTIDRVGLKIDDFLKMEKKK
jgi:uncharacterized membrane protein (UPF0127 family)